MPNPVKKLLLWMVPILILLLASFYIYWLNDELNQPMFETGESQIIEIKPNSSAYSLIQNLYSKKLIPAKKPFLKYIQYEGLANKLKTGIYQISPGESAKTLIHRIAEGDVLTKSFRIIEGTQLRQVKNNLLQAPMLNYSDTDWQGIAGDHPSAEGMLLAETYQYNAGSDARTLLLTANKQLLSYLEESWNTRNITLPYKNSYELLIVASILEKETALASERSIISGVVVNRLKRKMRLQMDPTVIYALGSAYNGRLSHEDMKIDSPFNTYRNAGLPPTPIAMVGKDAIDAAAHPLMSRYLYFVARGDGTHEFSETYSEQKKAIIKYMHKD